MTPSAMQTMSPNMQKMGKNLLDLTKNPTYVAKQNGSWFDPNTWVGGRVPTDGAKVSIGQDITVRYDQQSEARIETIGVEGQLKFATDKSTKLLVKNFVVTAEGDLEIGTKSNPVKAGVKAEIVITEAGSLDAAQLGRGLVSTGDVEIYGEEKTSHLKVAKDPMKGDRTLTLSEAPTNWRVGDRLVLTGTQLSVQRNGQNWEQQVQDEEVAIESINGKTVTLDRALSFDHKTPRSDLKAYVANQSRNVVFSSENAGTDSDKSKRGHIMFMHSNDVDVRYAEFKDLGRTNKLIPTDDFKKTGGTYSEFVKDGNGNKIGGDRKNIEGRYALHVHKTGTSGSPATLVGNSIDGSPGWGMTIHESSAIAENNVTYDIAGAAFVTESGNETGAFRNNIAINTGPGLDDYIEKQGTKVHDFGRTGVGFWFQGRLFENEGNVAAGSRNVGMFYFHRGVNLVNPKISDLPVQEVSETRGDGTVTVDDPPIQNFKNNEVFASGQGLKIIKDFPQQHSDLRTKMDGFKAWEVETGAEPQYTSHYILKDFDLVGSKDRAPGTLWKNQGLYLHKNTQDFVFDNMKIEGFANGIGMRPDGGFGGPTPPNDTQLVWVDLEMKNNGTDFDGSFNLDRSKWLKRNELPNKPLSFQISGDSDFLVNGDDTDGIYSDIKGIKTDSLGEVEMPIGDETLAFNYQGAQRLADKGYYTLPDGSRAAKFDHYFSDRLTGETIKVPVIIKFAEDWWWGNNPKSLGKLDPNSAEMRPSKVNVPESRFDLNLGKPSPTKPITPSQPTPTDEVDPVDPGNPTPTDEVDPVDPGNPAPTDEVDPIDPGSPVDPANPDDGAGNPPVGENPDPQPVDPEPPTKPMMPTNPLQPVASYRFEEGAGAYAEDTSSAGQDNRGSLWNGVAWADGVAGGGLVLNGTGSLNVKSSTDINRGTQEKRSVSMWFKPEELPAGKKQVIYEEGGANRGLNAYLDGDRLYVGEWQPNKSGDQSSWISTDGVQVGEWQHVAFVLDGDRTSDTADLTAYLNGSEIGSESAAILRSHGNLSLGATAGRTRFHDGISKGRQGLVGSIDETQVFNQALTNEQVKTLATQFG